MELAEALQVRQYQIDVTLATDSLTVTQVTKAVEAMRAYFSRTAEIESWQAAGRRFYRLVDVIPAETLADALRVFVWKSDTVRDAVGVRAGQAVAVSFAMRDTSVPLEQLLPPAMSRA